MPRPRAASCLLAVLVSTPLLAGCGSNGPGGADAFPLELRVSGGQTVRDDRATITADGRVEGMVEVDGGPRKEIPVDCVLEPEPLRDLADAASEDLERGATSPVPQDVADGETVTVSGPGGAAYDVGEGGSDISTLARQVITDLKKRPEQRTLCLPVPGSSQPAGTSSPAASPATSPVVLTRTGGLAGFDDRLEVAADGSVTGTTKDGELTCQVTADLAATLATGAAPSPAEPAAGTDRMAVVLTRGDGTLELGEGQGGDAVSEAARSLLDDVQQPADARTVCR